VILQDASRKLAWSLWVHGTSAYGFDCPWGEAVRMVCLLCFDYSAACQEFRVVSGAKWLILLITMFVNGKGGLLDFDPCVTLADQMKRSTDPAEYSAQDDISAPILRHVSVTY
jgi:hypothetical protein